MEEKHIPKGFKLKWTLNLDVSEYDNVRPTASDKFSEILFYIGKAKRMVMQCINGMSSNPVEGRTKMLQLQNLIIPMFGLIFRRVFNI